MNKERTDYLLQQFADNQLTDAEAQELLLLIRADNSGSLSERINVITDVQNQTDITGTGHWQDILENVIAIDKPRKSKIRSHISLFTFRRTAAAACFLLFISLGIGLYSGKRNTAVPAHRNIAVHDILPGGNKAVLTLANGEKIILSDKRNGTLARQENITITKVQNGRLQVAGKAKPEAGKSSKMLMVQTPVGGTYEITLPDGTRVWLNAASGIRFPSVFATAERRVEISGEVYFEVAKNPEGKRVPFIVTVRNQQVEVLGTHFNINAYTDEDAIRTTLLEGSVKVSNLKSHISGLLSPGRQSVIKGNSVKIEKADAEAAVAWKNNLFRFKDAELQSVMRQLARWYDIEVSYIGINPDGHLTGYISRDVPISRVLKMLQETSDLHFSVSGRQVTVTHN